MLLVCLLDLTVSINKQIDLRKVSRIQFIAPSPYPVITFGPFASPTVVLKSLSRAVGDFPVLFRLYFCGHVIVMVSVLNCLYISCVNLLSYLYA